jgi:hypothetical protein
MSQTKQPTKSHLDQVRDAVHAFEEVQKKWRKQGAYDTEPDGIWQGLLRDAVLGRKPDLPGDAAGWELYSSDPKSEPAAQALNDAADAAITAIRKVPTGSIHPIKEWLKGYCWRTSLS